MTSNASRASALVQLLRAAIDGDERTISELCAEDLRVWTPARSASSRDEVVRGLGERDDALSYAEPDVVPLDVGGPFAAAEWSVRLMRRHGDAAAPDGITLYGAAVAEFRGEEICALRVYWDEVAIVERLGPQTASA